MEQKHKLRQAHFDCYLIVQLCWWLQRHEANETPFYGARLPDAISPPNHVKSVQLATHYKLIELMRV